jgi:transmembrane sensor
MKSSLENFPSPEDDAIDTAAAAWLCEREDGFTPARAEEFAAWRAADPRHAAALYRAESAMTILAEELPPLRESLTKRLTTERVAQPAALRVSLWAVGLAAALMLAAAVWFVRTPRPETPRRYVVANDTQPQQVALHDGSVINLNTGTDVSVLLTRHERHITLAGGEAHFDVAHDTARPFIVRASGVTVRAVGTAFNVRIGVDGVEVLVTEGKVEITRDNEKEAPASAAPPAFWAERPLAVAGQRVWVARGDSSSPFPAPAIERASAEALRAAIQWHSQVMTFSDLPLRDVVAQFNRRNAIQLTLADAALGERLIGGAFAVGEAEAFVRLLEQDGEVIAERRGASEIVLHRSP